MTLVSGRINKVNTARELCPLPTCWTAAQARLKLTQLADFVLLIFAR